MTLKFKDIFTGKGMRTREKKRNTLIKNLLVCGIERTVMCVTRLELLFNQGLCNRFGFRTGNPHYADTTAAGGSGNGGDSVVGDVHCRLTGLGVRFFDLTRDV